MSKPPNPLFANFGTRANAAGGDVMALAVDAETGETTPVKTPKIADAPQIKNVQEARAALLNLWITMGQLYVPGITRPKRIRDSVSIIVELAMGTTRKRSEPWRQEEEALIALPRFMLGAAEFEDMLLLARNINAEPGAMPKDMVPSFYSELDSASHITQAMQKYATQAVEKSLRTDLLIKALKNSPYLDEAVEGLTHDYPEIFVWPGKDMAGIKCNLKALDFPQLKAERGRLAMVDALLEAGGRLTGEMPKSGSPEMTQRLRDYLQHYPDTPFSMKKDMQGYIATLKDAESADINIRHERSYFPAIRSNDEQHPVPVAGVECIVINVPPTKKYYSENRALRKIKENVDAYHLCALPDETGEGAIYDDYKGELRLYGPNRQLCQLLEPLLSKETLRAL